MDTRSPLYRRYWKLRSIIAPGLCYSQSIYEGVLREHGPAARRWLDLGSGHQLLPPWRDEQERELVANSGTLVAFDRDANALRQHATLTRRVLGDMASLPFLDGSFDLVTANMVFEHVQDPKTALGEIGRILRPGGRLVFHTPNVFGYTTALSVLLPELLKKPVAHCLHGRAAKDVYPTFYRFNSRRAIRRLADSTGFVVRGFRMIVSDAQFAVVPIVRVGELLLLRLLMTRLLRPFRTNIIAVLERRDDLAPRLASFPTACFRPNVFAHQPN